MSPSTLVTLSGLQVAREGDDPLHRQLYAEIRRLILNGRLSPGVQLPPTRTLARELGISRSTVVESLAQLQAEGYLTAHTGRGTFVSSYLPEDLLQIRPPKAAPTSATFAEHSLSPRGRQLANRPFTPPTAALFQPGLPDIASFPFDIWRRLAARHLKDPPLDQLGYSDPAGFLPLREALADQVALARGVSCSAEDVVITAGTQQAIYLATLLLTAPGDPVWLEDPGYLGARSAFQAAQCDIVPVPVGERGMDVAAGRAGAPQARLAYVTPSHQYPCGGRLDIGGRMTLLDWAQQAGAFILEDDYDSEFRYTGRPLAAMQGVDKQGRVLYIGSFSKVLFPGLRLGFLIGPRGMGKHLSAARYSLDRGSDMLAQLILNDFIREGHYLRHLRRMRQIYAQRQQATLDAIETHCRQFLRVNPHQAGLHLVGWLPAGWDDQAVSMRLHGAGINTSPISAYSLTPQPAGGLVLGFAAVKVTEIYKAVQRMALILQSFP